MSLSKENLSFFLVCFLIIILILVPFSDQILQDEGSRSVLPSAIGDGENPNPEKLRDDNHARRLKISSKQKPEKLVSAAETEKDVVLEHYHERDETVAESEHSSAGPDISNSDQEGLQQWQHGQGHGVVQGVGDTYMTVVGEGDDLEIVTVMPPILDDLNSLNKESHQNRKAKNQNNHKEKHRNKNHKQLLHTKELLLHPHSIQMKDALEHFKSVMQRLGNMTDLFERFLPSREVDRKTHSFIKKLRKLKKVSHNKGKGSRLKRHARPHPLPLSHHSVQYLKTLGFTQDDLRFYGLKDSDIFHPAGTGRDEVLAFKGTVVEKSNKLRTKRSTAETLERAKRSSDFRRSKRLVSQNLSRSKRSISESKRESELGKSVSTAEVSETKTVEETASKSTQDSAVEGTKIESKGVKNENDVNAAEPGELASPRPIVTTVVVLKSVDLKKENSPDASTADMSPSVDMQQTSATALLASHEGADKDDATSVDVKRNEDTSKVIGGKVPVVNDRADNVKTDKDIRTTTENAAKVTEASGDEVNAKGAENSPHTTDTVKVDLKSGNPRDKTDTQVSPVPTALKDHENSPNQIDSRKTTKSPPKIVESSKTALKSPIPTDSAVVVPEAVVDATATAAGDGVHAADCSNMSMQNETECVAGGGNANYIVNIAFIRNIMQDRSKDALYGILSLGLIVGTVLVAVLYTQMWRTKREGWFTPKDQQHNYSSHVKIREVLKSKARYLPMFHKKWKKGKKYQPLKQEDLSTSSEEEIYDQRRLLQVNSYED